MNIPSLQNKLNKELKENTHLEQLFTNKIGDILAKDENWDVNELREKRTVVRKRIKDIEITLEQIQELVYDILDN